MNKEKLQKKDGKASAKARKEKKYIKQQLEIMLQFDLKDVTLTNNMHKLRNCRR